MTKETVMMINTKRINKETQRIMRYLLMSVILLPAIFIPSNSFAGVISGKVTAPRPKYAYNTVVYIDKIPDKTFTPLEKKVVMDQKKMKFIPHILPVLVGTTVDFLNNDEVLHNIFTPDKVADKFNLGTYPKGVVKSHTFDKPGVSVMLCNVHPEMEAWVIILETQYFGVVKKDGSYTIPDVPGGDYTVKVWNKRKKMKAVDNPFAVSVPDEGSVNLDITMKR